MRKGSGNLKKIALSRETLLGLTSPGLRQVAGGITLGFRCQPETDQCSNPCTGTNSRCGC
jgi:hypothetical protein